jgi:hypothetical protein
MAIALGAAAPLGLATEEWEQPDGPLSGEMPLRRTLAWAARLPDDVLPSVLLCHYARVANVIAASWDDPAAFRTYMYSLSTEKVGNPRRFTPDALDELLVLQRYFEELNPSC